MERGYRDMIWGRNIMASISAYKRWVRLQPTEKSSIKRLQ
jgi:hypothetical protein